MDSTRSSADESRHKAYPSITSSLVSAVLEWMLMFMIFLDATFAYLVTRFARRHELRAPCLLCSRLDHVLGNDRTGFYWSLICHEHKSKISSLILCRLHNNLVDVGAVCESCFCYKPDAEIVSSDDNIGSSSTRKCSCCNEQQISGTRMQKFTEKSARLERSKDTNPLPEVEYSQIKDTSDSEAEGVSSDTENDRGTGTSGQESLAKFVSSEPEIVICDHSPAMEKLIHPDPPIESFRFELENPTYPLDNVEELNSSRDVTEPSEPIYASDVRASSVDSKQNDDATIIVESEKEVHVEPCTDESWKQAKTEFRGNSTTPRNEMDSKPDKTETSSHMVGPIDLGDAYRLAVGARGRQLSGKLEQNRSITDRVSEDLKLLLSQISSARGLDFLDISPRVSANTEDFKSMDAPSAVGLQVFSRRISLERNESNLSLDGSTISEIEGESEVDRLKRQVEHDKKILHTLYKELEEERNASAIAANQAMAMITRLQEEKAAFHMEALQCVRMMEEQAEYDGEALQTANALLAEKEKQIRDFQFELDVYRNGFGDAPSSNKFVEKGNGNDAFSDSDTNKCDIETLKISSNQFEDEKRFVLESLRILEEKLSAFNESEGFSRENGGIERNHRERDELVSKDPFRREESGKDAELAALRHQLSVINNRLEALEVEQNVIESSINALEKGSEGFEFIRAIAARLHELRSDRREGYMSPCI